MNEFLYVKRKYNIDKIYKFYFDISVINFELLKI
jgi:hypothetical protein